MFVRLCTANLVRVLRKEILCSTVVLLFVLSCYSVAILNNVACAQQLDATVAERAFNQGEELFRQGTAESFRNAIRKYQEAVQAWHVVSNRREAETLSRIAVSYYNLDEYAKAREYYTQSYDLYHTFGDDPSGEAFALNGIGNVYWSTGDPPKALEFYNRALELRRVAKKPLGEAYTLVNIGSIYWTIGESEKAFEYHRKALSIARDIKDNAAQGFALYNMGLVYATRFESENALQYYGQALGLQRAIKDSRSESATLNNIGLVYAGLGEDEKALGYYSQALAIRRQGQYRPGIAITLRNIGDVYTRAGETEKALKYYTEAAPLSEAVGDRRGQGYILESIGIAYWRSRQYEKALSYFAQAFALFEQIRHKAGKATSLANLGSTYSSLGQNEKASDYLNSALLLFREIQDHVGEIRTQYEIARIERHQGKLTIAHDRVQKALDVAEALRVNLKTQELRASYFATVQDYYDLEIDILMQLHKQLPQNQFDALALQISEQSRARSLIEMLTESRVDIYEGADRDFIQQAQLLRQQLNQKTSYRTSLIQGPHNDEYVITLGKEIDVLTEKFKELQSRLKEVSPHYAALTQPQALGIKAIQNQVLDSNTLLLEYTLGSDRSFVWAVSSLSIRGYELPTRQKIEIEARKLYDSLRAPNYRPKNETPEQRADRLAVADREYVGAAHTLSRMLLEPVANELGKKRLLIVAQGALQYVPFAALPVPTTAIKRLRKTGIEDEFRPLISNHEIVNLPSASALAVLRGEVAKRRKASKDIVVLADPVFNRDDLRVKYSSPESGAVAVSNDTMPRLQFSAEEARNIVAVKPNCACKQALGFDANYVFATGEELRDYRIVHFATHVRVDAAHPQNSEMILSRVYENGGPQNGSLRLSDVYNLKLSSDLVVLSGCETALGKDIRGEGMVGLTRGFMYAGARRVVASLWQIDDRATAELMKRFYELMLRGKGLSPAAALREAQIDISKKGNWKHPYYWAAFTIQGEPN